MLQLIFFSQPTGHLCNFRSRMSQALVAATQVRLLPYVASANLSAGRARDAAARIKRLVFEHADRTRLAKFEGLPAPELDWSTVLADYRAVLEELSALQRLIANRLTPPEHEGGALDPAEQRMRDMQADGSRALLQPRTTDFSGQWTQTRELVEVVDDRVALVHEYVAQLERGVDRPSMASATANATAAAGSEIAGQGADAGRAAAVAEERYSDIEDRLMLYNRTCVEAAVGCARAQQAAAAADEQEALRQQVRATLDRGLPVRQHLAGAHEPPRTADRAAAQAALMPLFAPPPPKVP